MVYGNDLRDRTVKPKQGNGQIKGSLGHTRIVRMATGSEDTVLGFLIIKEVRIEK